MVSEGGSQVNRAGSVGEEPDGHSLSRRTALKRAGITAAILGAPVVIDSFASPAAALGTVKLDVNTYNSTVHQIAVGAGVKIDYAISGGGGGATAISNDSSFADGATILVVAPGGGAGGGGGGVSQASDSDGGAGGGGTVAFGGSPPVAGGLRCDG